MPPLRMFKINAQRKEPVRFPLQELIKQGKLPNFGERFKLAQLPEMSRNVFKRISQIYGIPVNELLPVHMQRVRPTAYTGIFTSNIHATHFHNRREIPKRTIDHELLHSAQAVLGGFGPHKKGMIPREKIRVFKKARFDEKPKYKKILSTLANKSSIYRLQRYYAPKIMEKALKEASISVPQRGVFRGSLSAARSTSAPPREMALPEKVEDIITGIAAHTAGPFLMPSARLIRDFYNRHGTDGLILLYASPPRGYTASFVNIWERRMVNKGYIAEKGGLTKRGIRLLRSRRPREKILLDLKEAQELLKSEGHKYL